MAIKRLQNGQFKVESRKQAVEAYENMLELQEAISELRKESGIDEMEMDAVELKKAADRYLAEKEIEDLPIPKIGKRAKLVKGFDGVWVETKADALKQNLPAGVRNLKSIVGSEIWKRITKRRLDPEKLAEAIAIGDLTEDEISDAYYEKPRAPYVRIYDE